MKENCRNQKCSPIDFWGERTSTSNDRGTSGIDGSDLLESRFPEPKLHELSEARTNNREPIPNRHHSTSNIRVSKRTRLQVLEERLRPELEAVPDRQRVAADTLEPLEVEQALIPASDNCRVLQWLLGFLEPSTMS